MPDQILTNGENWKSWTVPLLTSSTPENGMEDSTGKVGRSNFQPSFFTGGGWRVSFKSNVQKKLWSLEDDCCFLRVGDDHLCIQVVEEDYPKENEAL